MLVEAPCNRACSSQAMERRTTPAEVRPRAASIGLGRRKRLEVGSGGFVLCGMVLEAEPRALVDDMIRVPQKYLIETIGVHTNTGNIHTNEVHIVANIKYI